MPHHSGGNLGDRQSKVHRYSEECGLHPSFREPLRESVRARHVLVLTMLQSWVLHLARRQESLAMKPTTGFTHLASTWMACRAGRAHPTSRERLSSHRLYDA